MRKLRIQRQLVVLRGFVGHDSDDVSDVFLIYLTSIHLPLVLELLNDIFVSPDVMKLGFRFKQDLVYLSSIACAFSFLGFYVFK